MAQLIAKRKLGIFLASTLVLLQLFLQWELYSIASVLIIILLVSVVFFSEEHRVFVWLAISYFAGIFAYFYLDRILVEFPLAPLDRYLWNRFLLLVPILLMGYVLWMFKKNPLASFSKPDWAFTIRLFGAKLWQPKTFYTVFVAIHFIILCFLFIRILPVDLTTLGKALLYSLLNGLMVEFIYRGILLRGMIKITGPNLSVLYTSIMTASVYQMFGFSSAFTVFYFILSLFLGWMTTRTKSILPSILWNFLIMTLLIVLHIIPLLLLTN